MMYITLTDTPLSFHISTIVVTLFKNLRLDALAIFPDNYSTIITVSLPPLSSYALKINPFRRQIICDLLRNLS